MLEKAVIYNTIDRVGICPIEVFHSKILPLGVSTEIELTKEQMRELFQMYDRDKVENTDKFWYTLLQYLHDELLKWATYNDIVIHLKEDIQETTIPKKYYQDAGLEEPCNWPHTHRPYGNSDFTR